MQVLLTQLHTLRLRVEFIFGRVSWVKPRLPFYILIPLFGLPLSLALMVTPSYGGSVTYGGIVYTTVPGTAFADYPYDALTWRRLSGYLNADAAMGGH